MNITYNNYDWLTPDDEKNAYHTRTDSNNGSSNYNYATGQTGQMRYKRVGTVASSYFWDAGSNLGAGGWEQTDRGNMNIYASAVTPVVSFIADAGVAAVDVRMYNFIVRSADELSFF
jgi:hypothetical protein